MTRHRVNIKAILADPLLAKELTEGATDFICKLEGIRPSFETECSEAVFKANQENGLSAALLCIAERWSAEIKGQPKTEFIHGISNSIAALREIAEDIEQATKPHQ